MLSTLIQKTFGTSKPEAATEPVDRDALFKKLRTLAIDSEKPFAELNNRKLAATAAVDQAQAALRAAKEELRLATFELTCFLQSNERQREALLKRIVDGADPVIDRAIDSVQAAQERLSREISFGPAPAVEAVSRNAGVRAMSNDAMILREMPGAVSEIYRTSNLRDVQGKSGRMLAAICSLEELKTMNVEDVGAAVREILEGLDH